jgi:hypothetical protein
MDRLVVNVVFVKAMDQLIDTRMILLILLLMRFATRGDRLGLSSRRGWLDLLCSLQNEGRKVGPLFTSGRL